MLSVAHHAKYVLNLYSFLPAFSALARCSVYLRSPRSKKVIPTGISSFIGAASVYLRAILRTSSRISFSIARFARSSPAP